MVVLALWAGLAGLARAASTSTCFSNDPDEVPPFLADAVDPNLLLMIDNSGSMYDMAYTNTDKSIYCYDDSFSTAIEHTGYFDPNQWYRYDLSAKRFVADANAYANALGTTGTVSVYDSSTTNQSVCIAIDESVSKHKLKAFAAKGNLLNWATASKFDIQKKILTGGKYDAANQQLVMESRGCVGRRFVKDIPLDNGKFLTLAIRPPEDVEKVNNADDTTRIEVFGVSSTGFDDDPCQQAVNDIPNNMGQLLNDVNSCLGWDPSSTNTVLGDSNAAFNNAVQYCWYQAKFPDSTNLANSLIALKQACKGVYDDGVLPASISAKSDSAYVCSGAYNTGAGYLGRCWNPGGYTDPACSNVKCTDVSPAIEPQADSKPFHDPFCGADGFIYLSGRLGLQRRRSVHPFGHG
ncbi:MAG: hypothetical protein P8Y63_15070 [Deltaproteobacteria bacterium]